MQKIIWLSFHVRLKRERKKFWLQLKDGYHLQKHRLSLADRARIACRGRSERESVHVCVWGVRGSERKKEETRGQQREKQRGGWVKEGGSEECKWGWREGEHLCLWVCTHRGVVLGEALMEKPCAPTPPLPSPPSWSTQTHTHTQNQLNICVSTHTTQAEFKNTDPHRCR